jgi:hypothetical protein
VLRAVSVIRRRARRRTARVAASCVTAVAVLAAGVAHHSGPDGRASYYLALGDSLSVGVQPSAAGTDVPTGQGYPDQLAALLRPAHPGLRLVKLGCSGETTATMINGGYAPTGPGHNWPPPRGSSATGTAASPWSPSTSVLMT